MDGVDQVAQVSAESVKFPHQESVPVTECLQACRHMRTAILLPGSLILIEVTRLDSGDQERVSLEIGALRPESHSRR